MEPSKLRNQNHLKPKQTKQKVILHFSPLINRKNLLHPKFLNFLFSRFAYKSNTLQVLNQLSSTMQETKSQNNRSVNENDNETLADNDNRNENDEINSFPNTIVSEDAQNQLPPLPEPTILPVQSPTSVFRYVYIQ